MNGFVVSLWPVIGLTLLVAFVLHPVFCHVKKRIMMKDIIRKFG